MQQPTLATIDLCRDGRKLLCQFSLKVASILAPNTDQFCHPIIGYIVAVTGADGRHDDVCCLNSRSLLRRTLTGVRKPLRLLTDSNHFDVFPVTNVENFVPIHSKGLIVLTAAGWRKAGGYWWWMRTDVRSAKA